MSDECDVLTFFCMEDASDESRKYVCVSVFYVTWYLAPDTKQIMTEGRCGPILMNSVAFGTLPGLQASVDDSIFWNIESIGLLWDHEHHLLYS